MAKGNLSEVNNIEDEFMKKLLFVSPPMDEELMRMLKQGQVSVNPSLEGSCLYTKLFYKAHKGKILTPLYCGLGKYFKED